MLIKACLIGVLSLAAIVDASSVDVHFHRALGRRQAPGGGRGKGGNQNFGGNGQGGNTGGAGGAGGAAAGAAAGGATGGAAAGGATGGAAAGGGNNKLVLSPELVQTASDSNGAPNATAGETASLTDPANFIQFCQGKTLTNGTQNTAGSCNGIPIGQIPAVDKMASTLILSPKHNDVLKANTSFDIVASVRNIQAGNFVNAQRAYYSAPQFLNNQGVAVGHVHFTCEDLGDSLNPTAALDAQQFVFFKGIREAQDAKSQVKATVTGGLDAGFYRCCSLTSSANHQLLVQPVANRGSTDDCVRFQVTTADGKAPAPGTGAKPGNAGKGTASGGTNVGGETEDSETGNAKAGGAGAVQSSATANATVSSAIAASSAKGAVAASSVIIRQSSVKGGAAASSGAVLQSSAKGGAVASSTDVQSAVKASAVGSATVESSAKGGRPIKTAPASKPPAATASAVSSPAKAVVSPTATQAAVASAAATPARANNGDTKGQGQGGFGRW